MSHALLQREDSFLNDYRKWFDSTDCKALCSHLLHQYELFKSLPLEVDKSLRFLTNDSSVGIRLQFHEAHACREAKFFMEFFKDKIQSIGYQKQLADRQTFETPKGPETLERYYLKPPFRLDEQDRKSQQFGNVMLSVRFAEAHKAEFQCLCHFFKDRQYTDAEPINYLLEIVLNNA